MAAQLPEWPKGDPLVAGEPVTFTWTLTVPDGLDTAAWQWRMWARSTPRSADVVRFSVDADPDVAHRWHARLSGADSRRLTAGWGADLWLVAPVAFVYMTVEALNVVEPFSYDDEGA